MQTSSLQSGAILKSPTQEYRIVQVLGAGSFGITYLATSKVKYGNVSFNVKFAIKEHFMDSCYRDQDGVRVLCTPTSRNSVEQSRNDFLNEARRLQDICKYSRNIVHVNEAFEANGTAYYVMEYLDGGSPQKMGEHIALQYMQQIAAAVKVLHEHKLLHLDIKPDNIVLKREDSGTIYPVLIDFGITKHFDEKGNPTSSPNAKGISLGYAPIEQNDVIREFAPTLDIYALGATLLYLLTGKNPPSSVKLIDSSQKELNSLIPSNVSKSTRTAILKAMKPNKNERTQTVSSFLEDLHVLNDDNAEPDSSGSTSASVSDEADHHTKPINNKKKSGQTEPIKKKRPNKKTDDDHKWLCPSRIVMIISFMLSLTGLGFYDSSLMLKGVWCLLGLGGSLALSLLISKLTKANSGLVFVIELFIFVFICSFLDATIFLWIIFAVFILSLALPLAFISDNKLIRWGTAAGLLCASAFFGYVWYSQNILHNMPIEETVADNGISEEDLSADDIVYEIMNINGHDCVDMGLSVNWATYNLGAGDFGGSPAVIGDFYAYGKLTPIDSASNVKAKDVRTMYKSIAYLRENNIINSDNNLTAKFDAATSLWGAEWRTPTIEELKELFAKCKREFGQVDGRNGIWFTGPSGATIFLPAQGYSPYKDGRDWNDKLAYYLSSTVNTSNDTQCYGISFKDDSYHVFCPSRDMGLLIRPVSNKNN